MIDAAPAPRPPRSILSTTDRFLRALGAGVDEAAVRYWMRGDAPAAHADAGLRALLERGRAFYGDPRLLREPERFFAEPPRPAAVVETRLRRLPHGDAIDLTFPSAFRPTFPEARADFAAFRENGVVHARWWRHSEGGRATVLCLHGYASGDPRIDGLAFGVRRLYRAGLDVLLYTLPFHGRRRPAGGKSGAGFFGPNMLRTNEAFAQTIFETRALMRHVRAAGGGPVGAFGMSLGAYATALLATLERDLAFAIAMVPVASLPELVWGEPIHRHRRTEVEAHGITLPVFRELWQVHAPLLRAPVVPHARRFIIGALGDRICPPRHAHALWEHWGRPRIHWYPGGHLAQFRRGRALGDVCRFLHALGLTKPHRVRAEAPHPA